jgi:hypothetical protein
VTGADARVAIADIVTVVYRREIGLLRLQARSMARYLDPEGIGRIVVIANDAEEDAVVEAVEAMREDYGPFAARLEVLRPDALFAARPAAFGPRGARQRLRLWLTWNRKRYPLGVKRGWRGNRGWSVQQALKLAAARHGESPFLLLLDAKNHFVREVGVAHFVSADGRAMSYREPPIDKFYGWIAGSFRLLKVPPPPHDAPAPPTITPYVVPRAVLLGTLEALERVAGPAEAFFARARAQTSEFMLIYAHAASLPGGWEAAFADGLMPPATIFRDSDAVTIDRMLGRVERGEAEVFSVHSVRLDRLTPEERARIAALWRERGLPAEAVFPGA